MCTGIVQTAKMAGSGKGAEGWFPLETVSVTYDCSYHTSMPQALNIDFFNETQGPSARVAVELSPAAAMEVVRAIMEALSKGGVDPGEVALADAMAQPAQQK